MDPQDKGKAPAERKRKHTFSEKELEVLIQEVVKQHDTLFGKKSLHVPESTQRNIWLGIQQQINAIGVTQRSIEELKKRWYDIRKRSKERVAERLQQAKQTGGGSPTAERPTALEELVETTLLPEAVCGIGNVDSSAPKDTTQGTAQPTPTERATRETETLSDNEEAETTNNTLVSSPSPVARRRHTVQPLPLMEDEEDVAEGGNDDTIEPSNIIPAVAPSTPSTSIPLGRRRTFIPDPDPEGTVFAGLEGRMLKVQRMQAKSMRSVDLRLRSIDKGMRVIAAGLNALTDTVAEGQRAQLESMDTLAGAVTSLCRQLQDERGVRRRQAATMQGYSKAVNRLCNATAVLSRRSVAVQIEMSHCSHDVSKGLTQLTCALEELKTANLAALGHGEQGDSEDVSSRSTITPPIPEPRRRSARQGSASDQTSHDGRATGLPKSVQRGRKQ